jgi:hypothetical protein
MGYATFCVTECSEKIRDVKMEDVAPAKGHLARQWISRSLDGISLVSISAPGGFDFSSSTAIFPQKNFELIKSVF